MQINWNSTEIKIRLTPIGKPIGRKVRTTSVFKEYGDIKPRAVQAIADMLDGELVYFSAVDSNERVRQTIPLTGWRSGSLLDALNYVAAFLEAALAKNLKVVCYGASRAKWHLDIEMATMDTDYLDNASDRGLAGGGKAKSIEMVEANGLRSEF